MNFLLKPYLIGGAVAAVIALIAYFKFDSWLAYRQGVEDTQTEITAATKAKELKEIESDEKIITDIAAESPDELSSGLLEDCRDCDNESSIRVQSEGSHPSIEIRQTDRRDSETDPYTERSAQEKVPCPVWRIGLDAEGNVICIDPVIE